MRYLPGTRIGPYEILRVIGFGGMGEVYGARDSRLGREVAIKILPEEADQDPVRRARFEQEARAASALNHPNLLSIYDIGTESGTGFMVSELIEGESLQVIIERGPIPLRRATDIATQIAEGLAAAHAAGIVHRDLKPGNIMLARDGRVKILDFGLAKQNSLKAAGPATLATQTLLTDPGTIVGTVGYMPPEQVRAQAIDGRSDIFSLGVILYEMLSGRRPFAGPSGVETMHAILNDEPEDFGPGIPPALSRVVFRCLEKSPGRRFQNAADLAFALGSLTSASGTTQTPVPVRQRTSMATSILAVVLLMGAAAALAYWVAGRRQPGAEPARFRQITFGDGYIEGAKFNPEGQGVVYSATWTGQPSRVYVARLGSKETSQLVFPTNVEIQAISARGDLALLSGVKPGSRGGLLVRSSLAGEPPREVLDHVFCADWSADGNTMAVVRRTSSAWRTEFPMGSVISESPVSPWPPGCRVSPDGTMFAYTERRTLWVRMASGEKKRLREIPLAGPTALTWTADSREIWFGTFSFEDGSSIRAVELDGTERIIARFPGSYQLMDIARDGKVLLQAVRSDQAMTALAPGEKTERDVSVSGTQVLTSISADGRLFAFTDISPYGNIAYVRRTTGEPAVRLTEGFAGELSPNGRWLVVRGEPETGMRIVPTGVGEERRVEWDGIDSMGVLCWFPDGRRFLASGIDSAKVRRFFTGDAESGKLQPANVNAGELDVPRLIGVRMAPDGSRFLARGADGKVRIYSLGGAPPVNAPGLDQIDPAVRILNWTNDGVGVYVHGVDEDFGTLYRVDLKSGQLTKLHQLKPATPQSYVQDAAVTPDGRSYVYRSIRRYSTLFVAEGWK